MLKWMKVRQSSSATGTSTPKTPISSALRQEVKIDEAKTEAEVDAKEEEEDSGMEREDTVSNSELSDLKKVKSFSRLISIRLINLHPVGIFVTHDEQQQRLVQLL